MKKLQKKGYLSLLTAGFSMAPVFVPQDTIVVCPNWEGGLLPGDIIVFLHKGRFIAHRFLIRRGDKLIAKGDNASYGESVSVRSVIGSVVAIEKRSEERMLDARSFFFRCTNIYFLVYSFARYISRKNKAIFLLVPWIFRGRRFILRFLPRYQRRDRGLTHSLQ